MSQRDRLKDPKKKKPRNHADCSHDCGCSQTVAANFGPIRRAAFIFKCAWGNISYICDEVEPNTVFYCSSHIVWRGSLVGGQYTQVHNTQKCWPGQPSALCTEENGEIKSMRSTRESYGAPILSWLQMLCWLIHPNVIFMYNIVASRGTTESPKLPGSVCVYF